MVYVTEVCPEDYEGIMALFKRHDMPQKNFVEWKHFWQDNPAFKDLEHHWPIGWKIKASNKIIGYLGNILLEYSFKGKKLMAATAHAWVVDQEYRKNSILLINNYFRQKNADFLLNTTGGNPVTQKVFSAYKARRIPVKAYDTSLFSIIDYPSFLKSFIKSQKGAVAYREMCSLSYPLSFLMPWLVELRNISRLYNNIGEQAKSCATFDSRFDEFWRSLSQQSDKLLCVRSSQCLNWRYKYALNRQKVWIHSVNENSQILAYAIFIRDDNQAINLKRVRLIDLQTLTPNPNIIFKLIASAEKRCRQEGIHMLEAIGFHTQKRQTLAKWLPHRRKLPVWPFYQTNNPFLEQELQNPDVWDTCLFDGDGSL